MSSTNAKGLLNRNGFGVNQNRPMTMRGRGSGGFFSHTLKPIRDDAKLGAKGKIMNFEEDLGDISIIKDQIIDPNQFLDEESFNQELLLMKLESQIGAAHKNNTTMSTQGNTLSNANKVPLRINTV